MSMRCLDEGGFWSILLLLATNITWSTRYNTMCQSVLPNIQTNKNLYIFFLHEVVVNYMIELMPIWLNW